MFSLVYLLATILCIWGGCLVARLIANRLELGLFRRKLRKAVQAAAPVPDAPITKRRSGWWTLAAAIAIVIGGGVAYLSDIVEYEVSHASRGMNGDTWDAALFALMIVGVGLSAGLVLVGFRFDPAVGRRRCPRCWYDLSATKGLLCSECGNEAPSEKSLYRTRRSRPTIAIAIFPLLPAPLVRQGVYASKVGWVGLIPTTVMALAWNYLPESVIGTSSAVGGASGPDGTFFSRVENDEVAAWQIAIARWGSNSVIRSSDDPRLVLRAVMMRIDERGESNAEALLRGRIAFLSAELASPDPSRQAAAAVLAQTLFYSRFEGSGPVPEIRAQKDSLIPLVLGPSDNLAIAAISLLDAGGCVDTIAPDHIAALEAILASPSTTVAKRYFTLSHLRNSATPGTPIHEMLLRLLDTGDHNVRLALYRSIFNFFDDPAINARAARAIRDEPVDAALSAARGVYTRTHTMGPELRGALLARFATDAQAIPGLWDNISYLHTCSPLTPSEIDLIRPGVVRSLESGDLAIEANALRLIDSTNDHSPEILKALDTLIQNAKPASSNLPIAKDLRGRLAAPDSK